MRVFSEWVAAIWDVTRSNAARIQLVLTKLLESFNLQSSCDIHSLIICRYFFLIIGRQFCIIESFQIKEHRFYSELLYFAGNKKRNSKYSSIARSDLISQRHAGTLSWDQMGPTFKRQIYSVYFIWYGGKLYSYSMHYSISSIIRLILSWLSCGNKTITDCLLLCHAWQSVQCHQASSGVTNERPAWAGPGQWEGGMEDAMAMWGSVAS